MSLAPNRFVAIPVEVLAGMKAAHLKLALILLDFADRDGRCWPALRTIVVRAGERLSWVQRNLAEMEELGYFTRRQRGRGRSFVYQLARRFLVWCRREKQVVPCRPGKQPQAIEIAESCQQDSQNPSAVAAQEPISTAKNGARSPAGGTEGIPKEPTSNLRTMGDGGGRCAPEARPQVRNPEAYDAAVARRRFENVCRGVNSWVGRHLSGNAVMEAWEAIAAAMQAGSWAAMPRHQRDLLRELNRARMAA